MLEKVIERRVCDYAKAKGFIAYKFTSPARAAVPDRLFISPNGMVFFIEFKAQGKKPTPQQTREHLKLMGNKALVFVVDNVDEGKRIIDSII